MIPFDSAKDVVESAADFEEATNRIAETLRGDAEPLARFGVAIFDVPWWRRRIQRWLMPGRFRLWSQREILRTLDEESL